MHLVLKTHRAASFGASQSPVEFVRSVGDFIDILSWGIESNTNRFLLLESNLDPAFYDLSTGLAGEILQKVSNYSVRLAIIGSFETVTSERFREFMRESNKGRSVRFIRERADAEAWLAS